MSSSKLSNLSWAELRDRARRIGRRWLPEEPAVELSGAAPIARPPSSAGTAPRVGGGRAEQQRPAMVEAAPRTGEERVERRPVVPAAIGRRGLSEESPTAQIEDGGELSHAPPEMEFRPWKEGETRKKVVAAAPVASDDGEVASVARRTFRQRNGSSLWKSMEVKEEGGASYPLTNPKGCTEQQGLERTGLVLGRLHLLSRPQGDQSTGLQWGKKWAEPISEGGPQLGRKMAEANLGRWPIPGPYMSNLTLALLYGVGLIQVVEHDWKKRKRKNGGGKTWIAR
ncbi:unnamed protein product [Linum trigynum]|uniref:Uncharacterized protein n=1 Tax=Linum trigynum TaxID=586398 RepID=A0AAV2E586_9ROSI